MTNPGGGRPITTDAGFTTTAIGTGRLTVTIATHEAGGYRQWSRSRSLTTTIAGIRFHTIRVIAIATGAIIAIGMTGDGPTRMAAGETRGGLSRQSPGANHRADDS